MSPYILLIYFLTLYRKNFLNTMDETQIKAYAVMVKILYLLQCPCY